MSKVINHGARTLPATVLLELTSTTFRRGYRKGSRIGATIANSIRSGNVEATATNLTKAMLGLIVETPSSPPLEERLGIAVGISTEIGAEVASQPKIDGGG